MTEEIPARPPERYRDDIDPVAGCACCACRRLRGETVPIPREVPEDA